ncbi:MAG: VOC family protein [Pseudomonadota bacterium]
MTQPTIVPYLSYKDGAKAIAFLTTAFGFKVNIRADGDDGSVTHAELVYGDGVVLLGTAELSKGSPGIYVVVDDVDAHHAHAIANGAELVYPPEETEWGTRRYRVKDIEGHEWTFGTYSPSTEPPSWG